MILTCTNGNLKIKKSDMSCSAKANIIIKAKNYENVGIYYCLQSPKNSSQSYPVQMATLSTRMSQNSQLILWRKPFLVFPR